MPDKGRSQKDLSPQVEHECGSTAGKAFDLFFVSFINEDVVVSVPFMNIEQMEIYKYNTNIDNLLTPLWRLKSLLFPCVLRVSFCIPRRQLFWEQRRVACRPPTRRQPGGSPG